MQTAYAMKYNAKKMKKLEKEYNVIKTKEQEEQAELKVCICFVFIYLILDILLYSIEATNRKQTVATPL